MFYRVNLRALAVLRQWLEPSADGAPYPLTYDLASSALTPDCHGPMALVQRTETTANNGIETVVRGGCISFLVL